MEKERFYVYVYLDPRKKGEFKYGDYEFEYEPFYVGKGHGKRSLEHLRESQLKHKTHKNNKIKKIRQEGYEPIIVKISENLFELDAFDSEVKLINLIGRHDLSSGPLTNKTDGGEGIIGLIKTKEHRKNLSISRTGYKHTDEAKKKISDSLRGKRGRNTGNKHSEETKKQISESKKGTVSWNAQSVLQLDKEDNIINEWRSASYAAEQLGLSQGNIWSVINGDRNTCGGYKWMLK